MTTHRTPELGRVALVHDWLVGQRGGENVLLELARRFAGAPIFTLVHAPGSVHPELEAHPIHTSFLQRWPGAPRRFRAYLPWFPRAIEAFDLAAFDTIVSTSHCVAHGVRRRAQQRHVCYVHTPMRYLYDQMPHYLPKGPLGRALAPVARQVAEPLRAWDARGAQRPTHLLANSRYVAARMARVWGREATVLPPPVDVDFFAASAPLAARHGYLVVSALVPYKRVDLAIDLANLRGVPLTVVGDGPQRRALQRRAGPTVRWVTQLDRHGLRRAYQQAAALWFCGSEDFGIVPVEAMAAGCPVLAYGHGGLRETVVGEGSAATGVFFTEPNVDAMADALDIFLARDAAGGYRREALVRQARRFDRAAFGAGLEVCLGRAVGERRKQSA